MLILHYNCIATTLSAGDVDLSLWAVRPYNDDSWSHSWSTDGEVNSYSHIHRDFILLLGSFSARQRPLSLTTFWLLL